MTKKELKEVYEQIEELKKQAKSNVQITPYIITYPSNGACPNCGRCPNCGKGNQVNWDFQWRPYTSPFYTVTSAETSGNILNTMTVYA